MLKLTLFHCINAIDEMSDPTVNNAEVRTVKLPCSSMVKDLVLLRAFEAGSDAVIVLTCPEGQCRHTDGNIRARKRVERVKKALDSIGLDGRRLLFFNVAPGGSGITEILHQALSELKELGPSPITTAHHVPAR
ncbi:MAG TPA: hydrogenase iron-sulfur subunit [Dehalococcoidia bacterium]|nr:hydrogenase iron-sulfur subunit [Dehalococcoidia bacterium]